MPKLGTKGKLALAGLAAVGLVLIGGFFFPVSQPGVELAANYGGQTPTGESLEPFYQLGPIYITNTFIAAWLSIIVLVVFFFFATRKMKLVPGGLQDLAEAVIETLMNFVEGVAGKENGRRFFPIVATIFLFVLMNAWLALLPFFNMIGRAEYGTSQTLFWGQYSGPIVYVPLFRSANTDINVPLMLALVSFVCVEYWGVTSVGLRLYLARFLRFKQLFQGLGQLIRGRVKPALSGILFGAIDVFVGAMETLSEFVRIISFTFRLFGNMTAGEILLLVTAFIVPWVLAVPFYGLETFLGFVQALIFAALTLVFATAAVASHESEH